MHAHISPINTQDVIDAGPLKFSAKPLSLQSLAKIFIYIGVITFGVALCIDEPGHFWASYLVNVTFFMGLACGGVVLTAIFQVVRARWTPHVARLAEANVSFLPWAFLLWLATYFGKEHLYPWARGEFPGRGIWMEPTFVYCRFIVLLGLLFLVMRHFVRMSLRGDVGYAREHSKHKEHWQGLGHDALTAEWEGTEEEVSELQPRRSWYAPLVIALYGVIYSLFAFEMIMAMDKTWSANMFGGFIFLGNIYLAWAVLGITAISIAKNHASYAKVLSSQQLWDMGKLTFAFCMFWGYTFWAHFLPQWYGNLPEETQWMILRTKEFPWKGLSWVVFPMCFIIPFILLLSRDLKKTPKYFIRVCGIIFVGIWLEKYVLIMPEITPTEIPFGWVEVGMFLGFLGTYILSIQGFLSKYPFAQVSTPAAKGRVDW